jgi:hypothetical protein
VAERDPRAIAVNISHTHAFSDGLTAGEWEQLQEALGPVPGPRGAPRAAAAAVHRGAAAGDAAGLPRMQELVHEIIATAFSNRVITPGDDHARRTWCGGCGSA